VRGMGLRVAIIGGGIVGAACALACVRAGAEVRLFDEFDRAGGATGVATGHLVTMADSPAQLALTRYSIGLWHELGPRLPAACGYREPGTLWLAEDDAAVPTLERFRRTLDGGGTASHWYDPRELAREEPALAPDFPRGLLVPGDGVVRPDEATRVLLEWAAAGGARIVRATRVLACSGSGVTLANGHRVAADRVIVAAGTDSARLLPGLRVRARRGHLLLTEPAPGLIRHQVLSSAYLERSRADAPRGVVFNLHPRTGGELVLGSSRDYAPEGAPPDPEVYDEILRRAGDAVPAIRALAIRNRWTGWRPSSPDDLPFIGPWPSDEGLWVAAGHEGLGVTTSLGTGQLIVDALVGRSGAIPMDEYHPSARRRVLSIGVGT
jgi:D-hydroxyproline dehydrogenase subunit beta